MGELFKHTNWFDPAQSDLHRRHHLTHGLYFPEKNIVTTLIAS
jgi:hypothetical protein